MKKAVGFVVDKAAGKALGRYFGYPALAAAGLFSAYKTLKSHKKIKEFERKYIAPLQEEYQRWKNAGSQLEGAITELSYYENVYSIGVFTGFSGLERYVETERPEGKKLVCMHLPDARSAYALVTAAKINIGLCKDQKKDEVAALLKPIDKSLYEIMQGKDARPTYGDISASIRVAVDEIKRITSDYEYDIEKLSIHKDVYTARWAVASVVSLGGAVLGLAKAKK